MTDNKEKIVAYKGFYSGWKCRGYQYVVGETYNHDGKVSACESGFHACEYPLDVFGYYAPSYSKFAVVEQSGEIEKHSGDSKIASSTISIKAEIDIVGMVKAAVEYITTRTKPAYGNHCTEDRSAATVEGKKSVAIATGYESKAKACAGSAIVLVNRDDDGNIRHIRANKVGENGIKPGVFYMLDESGEFRETE